jgi:hypothetical protein
MRIDIPETMRDPDGGEESRLRAEAKIDVRMKKLGIGRNKVRKGFELKAGDYQRGKALDRRVRAKILGF